MSESQDITSPTPTPTYFVELHRRLTWRVRLARTLRRSAYRLDPVASVVQNSTIDWEERILWVTPGPAEVQNNHMIGGGGSIRSAREYAGGSPVRDVSPAHPDASA